MNMPLYFDLMGILPVYGFLERFMEWIKNLLVLLKPAVRNIRV